MVGLNAYNKQHKSKEDLASPLDTTIITAFLKKDLMVVNRVLGFSLIDGGHNE